MYLNTTAGRGNRKGDKMDKETSRRETNGEGMKVKERETNRYTQEEELKKFVTLELVLTECRLVNGITNNSLDVVAPYSTYCSGSILQNKRVGKKKKIRRKERERGKTDYINWQNSLVNFHAVFNITFAYSISSILNIGTP